MTLFTSLLESVSNFTKNHDIAQYNASLPIEHGGLSLPKDNTAKDRAKAMGFDINQTLYHGTRNSFSKFDLSKAGTTDDGYFGKAIYLTPSSRGASIYASHDLNTGEMKPNGIVLPVYVKTTNVYHTNKAGLTDNELNDVKSKYDSISSKVDENSIHDEDEFVVFHPHHIRSIYAAFDPKRKHDADLLA